MILESLKVSDFRSCHDVEISLDEHLTLLVGENDAGKSNIIDALRLSIPPESGKYSLWFDPDRDRPFWSDQAETITIQRTYGELSNLESAIFLASIIDSDNKLRHNTHYLTDPNLPRRRRLSHTVGSHEAPDPEPENRDRIVHVYLPPLRDAGAALDSGGRNHVADLFRLVTSNEDLEAFEQTANAALETLASTKAAQGVEQAVQHQLSSVTQPVRHRKVRIKHSTQRLANLVRSLRMHMAQEGLDPTDLSCSGLGYANLLFIATVILQMERAREFDLMLLLIEEPEAHLHPQLQSVLLSYIKDEAKKSAQETPPEGHPQGRIQAIATSHSPYLAASVSTANLVVLRPDDRAKNQPGEHFKETKAVSLRNIICKATERRKIDRYLDATRAPLLFSRQIVLVEGIAEAVILRVLAESVVFPAEKNEPESNRIRREQFRAISVLAIGGVDFLPYLRLLLPPEMPLADKVVVVTDGDGTAGEQRKKKISTEFNRYIKKTCCTLRSEALLLKRNYWARARITLCFARSI